jgi:hypothetical protein
MIPRVVLDTRSSFGCKANRPYLYEFLGRAYNPEPSALKFARGQAIVVLQSVVEAYPDVFLYLDLKEFNASKPASGF